MKIEYNADGWVCHRYPTMYDDTAGYITVSEDEYRQSLSCPLGQAWKVVDGKLALAEVDAGNEGRMARINVLKRKLADTDYHVIKKAEGRDVSDYENIIAQREEWRAEINRLESEIDG